MEQRVAHRDYEKKNGYRQQVMLLQIDRAHPQIRDAHEDTHSFLDVGEVLADSCCVDDIDIALGVGDEMGVLLAFVLYRIEVASRGW